MVVTFALMWAAGVVLIFLIASFLYRRYWYKVMLAWARRFNRKLYETYLYFMTTEPGNVRVLTREDFNNLIKRRELKHLPGFTPEETLYYCYGVLFRGDFVMDREDSESLFNHVCLTKFGGVFDPIEVEKPYCVAMQKPDGSCVFFKSTIK